MTKSQWYVKNAAGLHGPLCLDELAAAVKSGRFMWIDFAIQVGRLEWKALIEIDELKEFRHPVTDASSALWVVYHQSETFSGPYDARTLKEKIRRGEVSYSDHIASAGGGEATWKRIGDCEEFNPGLENQRRLMNESCGQSEDIREKEGSIDIKSLMSNVVRLDLPSVLQAEEEVPLEAEGEDLVGTPEWMKFIGTFALIVTLFLMMGREAGAVSTIKIVPLKLQSSEPSLVFETDAKASEKITVTFVAESGEVLEYPSFRMKTSVRRRAGELPTLNLAELRLPTGDYQVTAQVGSLEVSERVFIGIRNEAYSTELEQHRKMLAAASQEEKRVLYYASKEHEKLAKELFSGFERSKAKKNEWRRHYKKWRGAFESARAQFQSVIEKAKRSNEVSYPDTVAALVTARERLQKRAQDLNHIVMGGGREPATSVSKESFIGEFTALKLEAGRL